MRPVAEERSKSETEMTSKA